jgi:matrixin
MAASAVGCAPADREPSEPPGAPLSFETFRASARREPWPGGAYIVEGDIAVHGDDALRAYYERTTGAGGALALVLGTDRGKPDVWGDERRFEIRYCVDHSFAEDPVDENGAPVLAHRGAVVDALRVAAARWEAIADVRFRHVEAEDDDCDADNERVEFNVHQVVSENMYAARAFYPNDERGQRTLNVDRDTFKDSVLSLDQILTHELGHALGFRHEHGRAEAPPLGPDYCRPGRPANWIALTPDDVDSVMSYPQCRGLPGSEYRISPGDEAGVQAVYGSPGRRQPDDTLPTVSYRYAFANVSGERVPLPEAFAVRGGSTFVAVLRGASPDGAPNLFVKVSSSNPKLDGTACQPLLPGDTPETCRIDLLPGADATISVSVSSGARAPAPLGLTAVYVRGTGGLRRPSGRSRV